MGPIDVTISNAPTSGGEPSNINAGASANTLSYTTVALSAGNSLAVTENVDLSNGLLGTTPGSVLFESQIFNLNGDVTMGTGGISLSVAQANLAALLFDFNNILLDDSKLNAVPGATGVTGTVNVASTVSLDQAIDLAAIGATVSVLDGVYLDIIIDKPVVFELQGTTQASFENGLLDATELRTLGSSLLTITGSGLEVDTGGGFMPVGAGQLAALTGFLRGSLNPAISSRRRSFKGEGGSPAQSSWSRSPRPPCCWRPGSSRSR